MRCVLKGLRVQLRQLGVVVVRMSCCGVGVVEVWGLMGWGVGVCGVGVWRTCPGGALAFWCVAWVLPRALGSRLGRGHVFGVGGAGEMVRVSKAHLHPGYPASVISL